MLIVCEMPDAVSAAARFDNEGVDRECFPGSRVKSNFICSIGYGDPSGVFDRLPRPSFNEVCEIV